MQRSWLAGLSAHAFAVSVAACSDEPSSEGDDDGGESGSSTGGDPFKQFVEQHRLSWTAWCASSSWGPPMFDMNYGLRVGEGQMGGFAKDWLYEKRDADRPAP